MMARDVMTKGPVAIRVNARIDEAIVLLQSLEVRHLPVVGHGGELLGIVSDRDFSPFYPQRIFDGAPIASTQLSRETEVERVMSGEAISVGPSTDLGEVIAVMLEQKIGAVPVIDGQGALLGIITYVDLLRALADRV